MSGKTTVRRMATTAAMGLTSILVATGGSPVTAATSAAFASAWSSPGPTLWFPLPPGSTNPLGPSDSVCVGTNSSPGGAEAVFTFTGFSIPAGDVIDGIEVIAKYRTNDSHRIQLTDGGSLIGAEKALPLDFSGSSNCDSTSPNTVGAPSDLWGTAGLTAADFNAGDIGVRIKLSVCTCPDPGNSNPIDLDSVEMIVHHSSGANQPPVAEANGDYSVPEGGSVGLSSAGSSDPDGDPLTIDWDLDNDGTFETAADNPTFSAVGSDGPSSQTVVVRVSDGSLEDTDSATVNITNVAPTIDTIVADDTSIDEGDSVTVSGTFSDPGTGETYTGTATWSDGPTTPVTIGAGTFSTTRAFPDDHPATGTAFDEFTVEVTIDDGDGGSDNATSPTIRVNNVDPTIVTIDADNTSIDEGDSVAVSGTFSDPALGVGTETFSGSATWSDGGSTPLAVGAGTFSTTRTFLDDDPSTGTPADDFTVDVTIDDDDLGSDTGTSPTITVNNVDPEMTTPVSSATFADKAEEGEIVTISGDFTDVGVLDTHTVEVDWGDGNVAPAAVLQGAGSGSYTAGHAYAAGGVYTVIVTITDDDTGAVSDSTLAVVTGVGINGGVLQVVGSNEDDHAVVKAIQDQIDVFGDFIGNEHRRFDLGGVISIEMWLCDGDDHGDVHQSILLPATIHGGDGDDMLKGGSGPDVINGEDGDDMLWGRDGDDTMNGGPGDDDLRGGKGTDVLDGGPGNNKLKQ